MKKALTIDLASVFWPVMSRDIEINPEYGYTEDTMTLVEILSRVVLYNDDHHTFDEVIEQVIKATALHGKCIAVDKRWSSKANCSIACA